ncbi:MAG: hypothetical protein HY763_13095 [Planctomycetes bacterium]|nr:hypothetical protein [Planctomycetota bacterium]
MRPCRWLCVLGTCLSLPATGQESSDASRPATPAAALQADIPDDASEASLIEAIRDLDDRVGGGAGSSSTGRWNDRERIVAYADALLARFPDTEHRDEVLVTKLHALGNLAWGSSDYLNELLRLTDGMERERPSEWLARESAFSAVLAFSLAARERGLPSATRLAEEIRRYEAFLHRFGAAEDGCRDRRPLVYRYLIERYLELHELDAAQRRLAWMEREYPALRTTRDMRAAVQRALGVGRPFDFEYRVAPVETVRSRDYVGSVFVLRVASSMHDVDARALAELYEGAEELEIVQINWPDGAELAAVPDKPVPPWPVYVFDDRLNRDVLPFIGTLNTHAHYLVDRRGVLRHVVGFNADVADYVRALLAEDPGSGAPENDSLTEPSP